MKAIVRADPLKITREVAEEVIVDHFTVVRYLMNQTTDKSERCHHTLNPTMETCVQNVKSC